MKRTLTTAIIIMLTLVTCIVMAAAIPATAADYLSPLDLVADSAGKTLYIAEATARQVAVFDIASGKVTKTIPLRSEVSGLALAADDSKLYVTGAAPNGRVFVVNTKNYRVTAKISVGHTPAAPVPSPDGKTLYICNRFNNNVSVIDLASRKETAKIPVPREPVAAAITADGKVLFVANHLPAGPSDGRYIAAEVSVIDTASNKVVAGIELLNGSIALRDITISPDGKHAYVPHILARYQLPTTQLERGWMNTNALTIIDVPKKRLLNTVLLDNVDLGAANPWSVACTADGRYVCVTTAGTGELSVIDRAKLHDKLARASVGEKVSDATSSAEDVPNDLSFLVTLRRRLKLTGNGPRGLALIGTKAYVAEYFTDSLGVVDINPDIRPRAKSVTLGPKKPMTVVRKGEMFFHDATLCFQKWQSCSSCHPGGARVDGLNWDLLNDGLGNPKNTKSLLLAHGTPPAMAMGARPDAESSVRAGIRHIQFAVRPEEDAVAIDEYLKSLKPVPSPHLVRGRLSRPAVRGRKLFEAAGCASCHTSELYTDQKKYELDTGRGLDTGKAFDTPTLVEVWRTAPYLHDGRAGTIADVLKEHNPNDKHGKTSDLTDKQSRELTEYILSL
jgi:YVTN family beta-propeller protein